jgi:PAS domain S-box-containing protein
MAGATQLDQLVGFEVLEQLPDAILVVDLQGTIRYANAQAGRLFSQENLVDAPVDILLPQHLRERHVRHRKRYALQPHLRPMGAGLDLAGQRADGSTFPVDIMLNPIEHRGEPMVIAVVRDVTERRATEAAARMNWAMFELLFERSPDAIFVVDERGRIEHVNAAAEGAFECSRERMRGQVIEMLLPERFRDGHSQHRAGYMRHPKTRSMGQGLDLWAQRADASEFPVDIMLAPMEFRGRRLALAVVRDITERRRAEDHLKLVMREVNHRTKNILGVVQAMAQRALVSSAQEFTTRFRERIQGLSASHDLLVRNEWESIHLSELVRLQLSHLGDVLETRISTHGPDLLVTALAAQCIGMALHELATNATKYGSLSNDDGRVDIVWRLKCAKGRGHRFTMQWSENGGPTVTVPAAHGFGWTVLCEMTEMSLGADARLEYPPSGFVWRIDCPAERVSEHVGEALALA